MRWSWRGKDAITMVKSLMTKLEIRTAIATDVAAAADLLAAAGLPVADLARRDPEGFLTATIGDAIAGFVGLEQYDDKGLLRSLIVDPAYRGAGLGRVLVAAMESHASRRGVNELWLLTIDADQWFARLGYEPRAREDAPDTIRQTDEFSDLCPDDAALMSKTI